MTGVGGRPERRDVRRFGDRALLVTCAGPQEATALAAALTAHPVAGQEELLPAARTVLVRLADDRAQDRAMRELAEVPEVAPPATADRQVTVETVYDGEDLDDVAAHLGVSAEGVVAAHVGQTWTAAFIGFAPGFAYLLGEDERLHVPRRGTPRPRVPAGAVALAGPWSAVYPRESPGGWQLVGRTAARMWDASAAEPALVTPGTRVRFRAVREVVEVTGPAPVPLPAPPPAPDERWVEVLATGVQTLVEDLGRPGLLHLGVGTGGAADRGAAVRANRLVGNDRGAAVLETVGAGLRLRAVGDAVVAVTGARVALSVTDGEGGVQGRPTDTPFALPDGSELAVGDPSAGLRAYVAVRGGLDVPVVLGSRSTDVLSGLGPAPARAGDVLAVGPPPGEAVAWGADHVEPAGGAVLEVRTVPGPRDDWLTAESRERLHTQPWTVDPRSSRVGLRLDGVPLMRARRDELASEGMVAGAVQVPPAGLPIVLLRDHPVTGGYPVVAVVLGADLDRLAQVGPGDRLMMRRAPGP